ncbi:TPA: hypothetical protein ACTXXA_003353, partial [Legionella anisa]
YEFSPQAADLIERKQKSSIGILKSLGMALICFSEFLLRQNKIKVDEHKIELFSFFKKQSEVRVKPTEELSEKIHGDLSITS